jgi:TetR/AcrR family transcriptional regulator
LVLDEGIASGELIPVDPSQIRYAALGANVFYFLSAPLMQMVHGVDLFEQRALELRRKSAIQYLGQTLFVDRKHGARIAARVLRSTPMPPNSGTRPKAPDFTHAKKMK